MIAALQEVLAFFISLLSIDNFTPLVQAIDRAGSTLQMRIHEPCLDPSWTFFVATTLAKQKGYRFLAFSVLCTTAATSAVLFIRHDDPSRLLQAMLLLGISCSLGAIVADWFFMATFGLIGGRACETWGCVLQWRAAVGRTRWRRFWVWHAYNLVNECEHISIPCLSFVHISSSLGLLIAIVFVAFFEPVPERDSAACGGWHCKKSILVPGMIYLGITSFRILLLYITYDAWFRKVTTTQAGAGPSRSTYTTENNVSPLNPGLDTGLADSGLDAVPFDSGLISSTGAHAGIIMNEDNYKQV